MSILKMQVSLFINPLSASDTTLCIYVKPIVRNRVTVRIYTDEKQTFWKGLGLKGKKKKEKFHSFKNENDIIWKR